MTGNLVYAMMTEVNPQGLAERGGVGKPKKATKKECAYIKRKKTTTFHFLYKPFNSSKTCVKQKSAVSG